MQASSGTERLACCRKVLGEMKGHNMQFADICRPPMLRAPPSCASGYDCCAAGAGCCEEVFCGAGAKPTRV
jgi:hypothetical protein